MSNNIMMPIGDDRVDITPSSGWQTIDLGAYLPSGATGAIVEFDVGGSFRSCGVRHPDSSTSTNYYIYTDAHCWFIAPCNDGRQIEVYFPGGSDHIYLHGYTLEDVTMLTERVNKTPASGSWQTVDCSAQAPGAVALIFEVYSIYPQAETMGARHPDSAQSITGSMRYHSFLIVGCNSAQEVELYTSSGGSFYLTGYITATVGFQAYTDWVQKTGLGSENTVDVSAIAPDAEMVMVYFGGAGAYYSIRKDADYSNNYSNGTGPMVAIMSLTEAQTFLARSAVGYCYIVGYAGPPLDSEDMVPNGAGASTAIAGLAGSPTHWQAQLSRDATFDPGVGAWGAFSGNFVYTQNNLGSERDLYSLTNLSQRLEGVVKIKWKARPGRSLYPFGNYWRSLRTHSTTYDGSEHGAPVWSAQEKGDVCEVLYSNPYTGAAWTLDELDDLQAGIRIGEAASFGTVVCDYVKITACWTSAEVQTDVYSLYEGTTARLNGTVLEDEGMDPADYYVYFQWGLTTAYGNNTTAQYGIEQGDSFYADISGLDADKTYHYRAVLVTDCGETMYGEDMRFPDRAGIWLGTEDDPYQIELTAPAHNTVLSCRIERGRDEELGHAASGICELNCDNFWEDFEVDKTDGEYYGYLYLGAYLTVNEGYLGVVYPLFAGKIDTVDPHPEPDNKIAYILAVDGQDDLAGSEIETVLRTDTDEAELTEDALDGAGWSATKRDIGTGVDTLQLGWFHREHALPGIQGLEESTRCFFLVSPSGDATLQNRHYRVTGDRLISQFTWNETLIELGYKRSKRDVKNWCRVTGYKYIDPFYGLPDETWIYYAPANSESAPFIPAGETITLWGDLSGPRKSSDTLVKGTHWNANTLYDKTGDDMSDDISLTVTYYGQSIKFVIENTGSKDAYLVVPDAPPAGAPSNATLLVYGTIYEEVTMTVVEEDTPSQQTHGKRTVSVDAKFKSNYNDIVAYAQWLKARYKDAVPGPIMAKVNAWTNYPDDTIKIECLERQISDRITLQVAALAVDQDFYVDKIIHEYVMNEGGTVHLVTFYVSRTEGQAEGQYWLLGEVGFSELGETTYLGF